MKGEAEPSPDAVKQLFLLEAVEARLALALVRLEEAVLGAGPGLDRRTRDRLQVRTVIRLQLYKGKLVLAGWVRWPQLKRGLNLTCILYTLYHIHYMVTLPVGYYRSAGWATVYSHVYRLT